MLMLLVGLNLNAQQAPTADSISTYTLDDVTVHATRLLLVTKNDTTIYDLDALTVKEGALLRDAFERLPGMSFRNGVLYHNGREGWSPSAAAVVMFTMSAITQRNMRMYG